MTTLGLQGIIPVFLHPDMIVERLSALFRMSGKAWEKKFALSILRQPPVRAASSKRQSMITLHGPRD